MCFDHSWVAPTRKFFRMFAARCLQFTVGVGPNWHTTCVSKNMLSSNINKLWFMNTNLQLMFWKSRVNLSVSVRCASRYFGQVRLCCSLVGSNYLEAQSWISGCMLQENSIKFKYWQNNVKYGNVHNFNMKDQIDEKLNIETPCRMDVSLSHQAVES